MATTMAEQLSTLVQAWHASTKWLVQCRLQQAGNGRPRHGSCGKIMVSVGMFGSRASRRPSNASVRQLIEVLCVVVLAARCDPSVLHTLILDPEEKCPFASCARCDGGDRVKLYLCVGTRQERQLMADALCSLDEYTSGSPQFRALQDFLRCCQLSQRSAPLGVCLVTRELADDYVFSDDDDDSIARIFQLGGASSLILERVKVYNFCADCCEGEKLRIIVSKTSVPVILKGCVGPRCLVTACSTPSLIENVVKLELDLSHAVDSHAEVAAFKHLMGTAGSQLRKLSVCFEHDDDKKMSIAFKRRRMQLLGAILVSVEMTLHLQHLNLSEVTIDGKIESGNGEECEELEAIQRGIADARAKQGLSRSSCDAREGLRTISLSSLRFAPVVPSTVEEVYVDSDWSLDQATSLLRRCPRIRVLVLGISRDGWEVNMFLQQLAVIIERDRVDTSPLSCGTDEKTDFGSSNMDVLCRLVKLMGPSIRRLMWRSLTGRTTEDAIHFLFVHCPRLEQLGIHDVDELAVDAIAMAHTSTQWRLSSLRLENTKSSHSIGCIRLLWYLSDPTHALTRSLRELRIFVEGYDAISLIRSAAMTLLACNARLRVCRVNDTMIFRRGKSLEASELISSAQLSRLDALQQKMIDEISQRVGERELSTKSATQTVIPFSLPRLLAVLSVLRGRSHFQVPDDVCRSIILMAGRLVSRY